MRKVLLTVLMVMIAVPAWAWPGSIATNFFASWINVDTMNEPMAIPTPSKSIMIQNGSAYPICVSLSGGTTTGASNNVCGSNDVASSGTSQVNDGDVFMLDADSEMYIENYSTSSLMFSYVRSSASPVNVVVSY